MDGFNLYHAIAELGVAALKWLDLRALAATFVDKSKGEKLESVFYYSAIANWNQGKANRHNAYLKALRLRDVAPVLGNFAETEKECRATCKQKYRVPSEKKTDVNLALGIVLGAYRDEYDKALVVTNDTDVIPALKEAVAKGKQVKALTPPGRRTHGEIVQATAGQFAVLTLEQIRRARLPDPVPAREKGKTAATCPVEWR